MHKISPKRIITTHPLICLILFYILDPYGNSFKKKRKLVSSLDKKGAYYIIICKPTDKQKYTSVMIAWL